MKLFSKGKKALWLVALPCCLHLAPTFAQTTLQWENVANAATSGGTVTKISGCDGCADAGANSVQQLTGDGYAEFNVTNNGGLYYAGLTNDYTGNNYTTIDHAVRLQGTSLEIRENGVYKGDTTVAVNDVIRIEIENGDVVYYKNGVAFYASAAAPAFPVRFDVALVSMGTSVANARGAVTGGGGGGTVCGLNDSISRIPADYTNFTPPALGASKPDPVFGCKIRRVTQTTPGAAAGYHEYSSINPFNADGTRIVVKSNVGQPSIVNQQGTAIPGTWVAGEYVWHPTNPNVLYIQPASSPVVNKYDFSTGQTTTVYNFTSVYDDIDFGGGEADVSDDGNYIVIAGSPFSVSGRTRIRVLNLSNGTLVGPELDTLGRSYDWFDMTATNQVVGLWLVPSGSKPTGIVRYDPINNNNWSEEAQLTTFAGHADRGRDINGDEIIVIASADDPRELCGNQMSGVLKVRVSDGYTTCLLPFKFEIVPHVSLNNRAGGHPWALISTYDPDSPGESVPSTAAPPSTLVSNWASLWNSYYNEILLVKLDGSEKRRLAHHRSREFDPPAALPYSWQPKAALNRDGRYVLFDSNFAQPNSTSIEYADVYLIDTQEQ